MFDWRAEAADASRGRNILGSFACYMQQLAIADCDPLQPPTHVPFCFLPQYKQSPWLIEPSDLEVVQPLGSTPDSKTSLGTWKQIQVAVKLLHGKGDNPLYHASRMSCNDDAHAFWLDNVI